MNFRRLVGIGCLVLLVVALLLTFLDGFRSEKDDASVSGSELQVWVVPAFVVIFLCWVIISAFVKVNMAVRSRDVKVNMVSLGLYACIICFVIFVDTSSGNGADEALWPSTIAWVALIIVWPIVDFLDVLLPAILIRMDGRPMSEIQIQ